VYRGALRDQALMKRLPEEGTVSLSGEDSV